MRRFVCFILFVGLAILTSHLQGEELSSSKHTYMLDEFLGKGRRAYIYKAFDEQGKVYAIKKLYTKRETHFRGASLKDLRLRYRENGLSNNALRGFRNGTCLHHPNILQAHDLIFKDRRCWVVMDFVEGKTLNKIEERSFDHATTERLIRQYLDVLIYLTHHGLCHNDLFGQNFMINEELQFVVIDLDSLKSFDGTDGVLKRSFGDYLQGIQVILQELFRFGPFTDQERASLEHLCTKWRYSPKFRKISKEMVTPSLAPEVLLYLNGLGRILL